MFLRNGMEPGHLLLVVLVVVLLFGARRLPDTARALGKSMRILKSEARAMQQDGQGPSSGSGYPQSPHPEAGPEAVRTERAVRTEQDQQTKEPSATR